MVRALLAIGATLNDKSLTTAYEMRGRSRHLLGKEDFTDSVETMDLVSTKKHVGYLLNQTRSDSHCAKTIYRLLKIISSNAEATTPICSSTADPPVVDYDHIATTYTKLKKEFESRKEKYYSHQVPENAVYVMKAMHELEEYRRTRGVKILSLDGGGIRGLVQLEMLRQIENRTGKKITHLFDWIVGSSTGGIIALALVYGMYNYTQVSLILLNTLIS